MVQVQSSQNRSKTPTVNVEVIGADEARGKIRAKGKDILNGIDSNVFQAANFLQQEVQEAIIGNRPAIASKAVDTGNLANSIRTQKVKLNEYVVETDVEYAKFVEYGTSKMPARPHWRNTLNQNRNKIITIIKGKQ